MIEARFEPLLEWLVTAGEPAGPAFQALRARLVSLLSFWGSASPDEAADEAFARVAKRLGDGEQVRTESRLAYLRGVAHFVFLEELRRRKRDRTALNLARDEAAAPHADPAARHHGAGEDDANTGCLEICLRALDPDARALLLDYYRGDGTQIERRQRIADALGTGLAPLRNRIQRLKQKLRSCIDRCLNDDRDRALAPQLGEGTP